MKNEEENEQHNEIHYSITTTHSIIRPEDIVGLQILRSHIGSHNITGVLTSAGYWVGLLTTDTWLSTSQLVYYVFELNSYSEYTHSEGHNRI